jgi:hypothetical protein
VRPGPQIRKFAWIYRKWKSALPRRSPSFKVIGKKKEEEDKQPERSML